jgi:hypothetical protein
MVSDSGIWSRIYRHKGEIVLREIAGETILVPIRGNLADMRRIFTVNRVGAEMWKEINGKKTLEEIRRILLDRFETTPEEVGPDMEEFVQELAAAGLIEESTP